MGTVNMSPARRRSCVRRVQQRKHQKRWIVSHPSRVAHSKLYAQFSNGIPHVAALAPWSKAHKLPAGQVTFTLLVSVGSATLCTSVAEPFPLQRIYLLLGCIPYHRVKLLLYTNVLACLIMAHAD